MLLRLQIVTADQGARWVRRGFQVFARRPVAFSALLLAFFFASLLASVLLPMVGGVLSLMALPLLSLGFMTATQAALTGGPVHPGQLAQPLRVRGPRRLTLLKLCALYGGLALLALLLADAVVGDAWEELRTLYASGNVTPEQARAATSDPRLMWGFGLQALLLSLLSVPFWHAPALVLWGGQGVAQALFSSTVAVWRARAAFTVYGLVWVAVTVTLSTLTALLAALLGMPQIVPVAAIPLVVMCVAVFYVTLYFSFTDSFAAEP